MKKLIFIALMLFATSAKSEGWIEPWSEDDVKAEVAYFIFHTVDWGQTRTIALEPDQCRVESNTTYCTHYSEINPIVGPHPSVGRVNTYFMAAGLLHLMISSHLSPKYRRTWQKFTTTVEVGMVTNNIQAELKMTF